MLDIVFVLLLTVAATGLGLWVLGRFDMQLDDPMDALALASPMGLGVISLAALALGEFGILNRVTVGGVIVVGLGLCIRQYIQRQPARCSPLSSETANAPNSLPTSPLAGRVEKGFSLCLAAFLAVALVGTFLTALTPVTDGDALCYHLQVPKVFLARSSVLFDPDLHETIYPLLTEMLYAFALAFRGPVACRLVQWVLGLIFAGAVTALARPSLGPRAWWAGTIALLVPAVSNGMSAPLNDVALAAFGTAALLAWSHFDQQPGMRRAILAGIFAGLALGVKYPALVWSALIGSAIAVRPLLSASSASGERLVQRLRRSLGHAALFGITALLVGGCWYLRAWLWTGNPVFPFFRHIFGGAGLDEVLAPIKRPLPVTFWNLLTAIAPMTLQPDRFDSFSHQFGPIFLLFLPALLWEKAPRRIAGLTALGYAFLVLCLTQRQSMRFVLLALGPFSVGVAWLASTWLNRRTWPGRALLLIMVTSLGFESSLALLRARHGLRVVAGAETAESYLSRREPTFRVGRWVDANLPADAHLVGQDHRGFYFPRPYTMELAHRRRTGLGTRDEAPAAVVAHLQRAGFTHLLLCPPVPPDAVEFDPTLGSLLGPWLREQTPLYQKTIRDGDGVARAYAIYDLNVTLARRPTERPR